VDPSDGDGGVHQRVALIDRRPTVPPATIRGHDQYRMGKEVGMYIGGGALLIIIIILLLILIF
jgi:hypothetical protein